MTMAQECDDDGVTVRWWLIGTTVWWWSMDDQQCDTAITIAMTLIQLTMEW